MADWHVRRIRHKQASPMARPRRQHSVSGLLFGAFRFLVRSAWRIIMMT